MTDQQHAPRNRVILRAPGGWEIDLTDTLTPARPMKIWYRRWGLPKSTFHRWMNDGWIPVPHRCSGLARFYYRDLPPQVLSRELGEFTAQFASSQSVPQPKIIRQ